MYKNGLRHSGAAARFIYLSKAVIVLKADSLYRYFP